MKQTNFVQHSKKVSQLISNLNADTFHDASRYLSTLRRSRLEWDDRSNLQARLSKALREWSDSEREQREALRPKLIEGGALVSRRSTAALRLVAS